MAAAAVDEAQGIPIGEAADSNSALRFEDLTIDDDLPLLERVVRYCRSGIALQRLVHVKMLAETAETVGMSATLSTLVPLMQPLVSDPESIIRQHLASQMLPLAIVCMIRGVGPYNALSVEQILQDPTTPRMFVDAGYKAVTSAIVSHLQTLITDVDMDVRRAASEALAGLASQIQKKDVATVLVPIPVALAQELKPKKGMPEGFHEELRITACHLLAELAGAAENGQVPPSCVSDHIWPTVLKLCQDSSFRVRRSAAQALPRVLGGTGSLKLAEESILPAFEELSNDDMYRVRKSTGECLVDMSRSLMLLAQASGEEQDKIMIKTVRRSLLIPIALQLLSDANKFVRHGMMQFLGPFIASFYPLEEGALKLPGNDSEFILEGIGSQFFPHASSMVSRLNASGASTTSSPTPTPATLDAPEKQMSERQQLDQCLPEFITLNRVSYLTLSAVVEHRRVNPPEQKDLEEIQDELLGHFCALSTISTGDDNTDAEMRVYCAYSYPAVVLLFGAENWQGQLQDCFLALVNPNHANTAEDAIIAPPPLPVKRCLASSLHTVAHVLGPELVETDILPVFRQHFLLDTDDSVRLNVIRNFPWLFVLLPTQELKSEYLSLWKDIVKGEDLLGAFKRSATNRMLLNWRQRNHVSRSLPDLIGIASATQVHEHIWPVLQMLLVDTVSLVREDAEWSIPTLLRCYCHENVDKDNSKRWSADCCQEVILWLKETILGSKKKREVTANFSKRQLYCRICAAVGLALRFGDLKPNEQWDARYRNMIAGEEKDYVAYQTLSPAERKHLRRLLVYDLLPPALEMKTDRVTNVRLTLMKVLQDMPEDIRELASVSEVLQELEDEAETWESFTGGEQVARPPPPPPPPQHPDQRAAI